MTESLAVRKLLGVGVDLVCAICHCPELGPDDHTVFVRRESTFTVCEACCFDYFNWSGEVVSEALERIGNDGHPLDLFPWRGRN